MTVPSWAFLSFSFVAAVICNLRRAAGWRRAILLITNLSFLATFSSDLRAYLPFVVFLALGCCGASQVKDQPRQIANAFIVMTLLCFLWLKRYTFLPNALLLPPAYLTVGVSYVFFRIVSLLIDLRDGTVSSRINLVSYLNYTLNFTSLVSGPIQRFQDYHRMESEEPLPLNAVVAGIAIERIIFGFFKVFLLSSAVLSVQHSRIEALNGASGLTERIGDGVVILLLYPLYLYINFSGYTDSVIGVARLFRIALPENFNQPFAAENFIDFWNRWHISLSSWLKTYVYTPFLITLMRRLPSRTLEPFLGVLAFFFTFFLVGLWHGQTSEFVFFGILQGGGVATNKLYQITCERKLGRKGYRQLCTSSLYRAFSRGLTFTWFAFSLLWFWASWRQIGQMASLVGASALFLVLLVSLIVATSGLSAGFEALRRIHTIRVGETPVINSRYFRTAFATSLVVTILIGVVTLAAPPPQIVYKAF